MKKQRGVQFLLISFGFFLILATYFYYPYLSKNKVLEDRRVKKNLEQTLHDDKGTALESVQYEGLYDLDKRFTVNSEKAYISDKEPAVVRMTNMHVALYLSDGRIVHIVSNKGRYNKVTYDCFFESEVKATDGETKIFSENLDLLADENSVKIYNDVYLDYTTGSLQADKIDYDFETKLFKVSMFDDEVIKMKITQ